MSSRYSLDSKFFNEDGSFNVESAMAAGRRAHSRGAHENFKLAAQILNDARHAIGNLPTRFTPSR